MNLLEEFDSILQDAKTILSSNQIPIFQTELEKYPDAILSPFELNLKTQVVAKPAEKLDSSLRNIGCKLCPKKIFGIKNFLHVGKIPILFLHYSVDLKTLKIKPPSQVLNSVESEKFLDGFFQKEFHKSWKDFYFQEYPACVFPADSTEKDWKDRAIQCKTHIEQTVSEHKIQAIVMLGSSARLRYGLEAAGTKLWKKELVNLANTEIPFFVVRSPDFFTNLEKKIKTLSRQPESSKAEAEKWNQAYSSFKSCISEILQ